MQEPQQAPFDGRMATWAYTSAYRILRNRHDAEDAGSEAILRILRAAQKRPDRIRDLFSQRFVVVAAYRIALDVLDRRKPAAADAAHCVIHDDPGERAESTETRARLARALDGLTQPQRVALILRYCHNTSYRRIASLIELSPSSIGSFLKRTKKYVALVLRRDAPEIQRNDKR